MRPTTPQVSQVPAAKQFCVNGHDTYAVGRTVHRRCRQCERDKDAARRLIPARAASLAAAKKRWRGRNREKLQEMSRRGTWKRLGINIDEEKYEQMLQSQDGVCAICKASNHERLHVDHDHETGEVRGLLCSSCNRALGFFRDNAVLLRQAAAYIDGEPWHASFKVAG